MKSVWDELLVDMPLFREYGVYVRFDMQYYEILRAVCQAQSLPSSSYPRVSGPFCNIRGGGSSGTFQQLDYYVANDRKYDSGFPLRLFHWRPPRLSEQTEIKLELSYYKPRWCDFEIPVHERPGNHDPHTIAQTLVRCSPAQLLSFETSLYENKLYDNQLYDKVDKVTPPIDSNLSACESEINNVRGIDDYYVRGTKNLWSYSDSLSSDWFPESMGVVDYGGHVGVIRKRRDSRALEFWQGAEYDNATIQSHYPISTKPYVFIPFEGFDPFHVHPLMEWPHPDRTVNWFKNSLNEGGEIVTRTHLYGIHKGTIPFEPSLQPQPTETDHPVAGVLQPLAPIKPITQCRWRKFFSDLIHDSGISHDALINPILHLIADYLLTLTWEKHYASFDTDQNCLLPVNRHLEKLIR